MARFSANVQAAPHDNLQSLLQKEFGKRSIESVEMPRYFLKSLNPAMPLRPYQRKCFQYFFTYWEGSFDGKEEQPHLLFHMATGSGKTLVMAGLMLYLYDKGYRNFLFFVSSTNIIEKTRENLLNAASPKYLFAPQISVGGRQVAVRQVDNFQDCNEDCINLCLTTTQGLHSALNNPKENALTYDDFGKYSLVMISDEAHHINSATKRGRATQPGGGSAATGQGATETEDWESTVNRIFNTPHDSPLPNVLLEFTATADLGNPLIAAKYLGKVIFDYPLKKFREDGYSKDIEVVQSDLPPVDRAMQAVVLSQYKRKLFASIGQDIKPVVMLKSKTIAENKAFCELFVQAVRRLQTADLRRMAGRAKGDMAAAFSFFAEKGVSADNLLLELREDFKEANLLLIDGNNISAEKQIKLNTLEAHDNEVRAVFAVDMLNEGWDVLNLFDIVRLYETRDARGGKPGKTTMQEAQLIGRGARYMPFSSPDGTLPRGQRKYDNDTANRLRTVEKLHYHSSHNPRYVQELHTALVETGIVAESARELPLLLKDSFKATEFYQKGIVFSNTRVPCGADDDGASLGEAILSRTYSVRLRSGEMRSSLVFTDSAAGDAASMRYKSMRMGDLGRHVVRAALNRFDAYRFSRLAELFPRLASVGEFIDSEAYLAGLNIAVYGNDRQLARMSQREKLCVAVEVLRQVEPLLAKRGSKWRGSAEFVPKRVSDVFRDHTLKVAPTDSGDREYGRPMGEAADPALRMDLGQCAWHAYNDCYGTSEEKHLVKYIESVYPKLREKYRDIYLVRNEKDLKLWGFCTGKAFEPDYLLFMRREGGGNLYEAIQIFIEPKGEHLRAADAWKEECLTEIKDRAVIRFSTASGRFCLWGLPFFTASRQKDFGSALRESLSL